MAEKHLTTFVYEGRDISLYLTDEFEFIARCGDIEFVGSSKNEAIEKVKNAVTSSGIAWAREIRVVEEIDGGCEDDDETTFGITLMPFWVGETENGKWIYVQGGRDTPPKSLPNYRIWHDRHDERHHIPYDEALFDQWGHFIDISTMVAELSAREMLLVAEVIYALQRLDIHDRLAAIVRGE